MDSPVPSNTASAQAAPSTHTELTRSLSGLTYADVSVAFTSYETSPLKFQEQS